MTACLTLVSPGLQASLQDRGRLGFGSCGVPRSGALDPVSLRLGNALVGNDPYDAAIEFRMLGPTIRLETGSARIGLACHADAELIEGRSGFSYPVRPWQSVRMEAGDSLRVGALKQGATGYLTVKGGIDIPPVLGSRSTYSRAGLGPSLSAGSTFPLRQASQPMDADRIVTAPPISRPDRLHILPGPQDDYFSEAEIERFLSNTFTASASIDRMGIRLEGTKITPLDDKGSDLISDGLVHGAIQIPGNGDPIILGADCQSVGGYPKIATIITADLHHLGQILPGSKIHFAAVDLQKAQSLLKSLEASVQSGIDSIQPFHGSGKIDMHILYSANLIDGMIDALTHQ